MASTSETGHAKNVANFEELISFCQGYGPAYNPSKNNLKIAQLQTQLTSVKANIQTVTNNNVVYNKAVNSRLVAFGSIRKLSTRLVNALEVSGASKELVKNAKSVNAKLQGSKHTQEHTVTKTADSDSGTEVAETHKTVSTSQQSYSSIVDHFSKMVAILSTEPTYIPNENELKVATLNAQLTTLKNTNTGVINAYTTISNSRIARDQSLYNPTNGLCATAQEVKLYVKSVFGPSSPQYKQISGIQFKARK